MGVRVIHTHACAHNCMHTFAHTHTHTLADIWRGTPTTKTPNGRSLCVCLDCVSGSEGACPVCLCPLYSHMCMYICVKIYSRIYQPAQVGAITEQLRECGAIGKRMIEAEEDVEADCDFELGSRQSAAVSPSVSSAMSPLHIRQMSTPLAPLLCVCVCVSVCVCVCVCMYVYLYLSIYMSIYLSIYLYISIYIYLSIYLSICIYIEIDR